MFLVLRKFSIKRSLALAVILIVAGLSLMNPFAAKAMTPTECVTQSPSIMYLYPMPQNNPIQLSGVFWLEGHSNLGYAPLSTWEKIAKGKRIAIGIPQTMNAGGLPGSKLGDYIKKKINGLNNNGRYDKDIFTYKRSINPTDGVTEEIKVEIGRHFKDNRNFEDFARTVRDHLITEVEIPEPKNEVTIPTLQPDNQKSTDEVNAQIFGGTMLLGGMALLFKVLILAL